MSDLLFKYAFEHQYNFRKQFNPKSGLYGNCQYFLFRGFFFVGFLKIKEKNIQDLAYFAKYEGIYKSFMKVRTIHPKVPASKDGL